MQNPVLAVAGLLATLPGAYLTLFPEVEAKRRAGLWMKEEVDSGDLDEAKINRTRFGGLLVLVVGLVFLLGYVVG